MQLDAGGCGGVFIGAVVEEGLVVDGLVGIEGAAVGQQDHVAPGRVVRADGLLALVGEIVALRAAQQAADLGFRPDVAVPVAVGIQLGDQRLGQVGEAVHPEVRDAVQLLAFAVVEDDVAHLHRLAGQVVRHEDAVAVQVALVRDGEGVAAVFALGLHLVAGALDRVVLVVDGGQVERERVLDVEAVGAVFGLPVEDLLLAVQDAQAHRRKVADHQGGLALVHVQGELVGRQGPEQALGTGAALRDVPLVAAETLHVVEEGLAVAGELAIVIGAAFFVAQLGLAALEQVLAAHHRDGLPGVVLDILLHLRVGGDVGHARDEGVFDEGVEGVASFIIIGDELADGVVVALGEQAPERVFVVVGHLVQQDGRIEEGVQAAVHDVELGIVRLEQALLLLCDVGAEVVGAVGALAVVEDRDRLAEGLDVLVGLFGQLVAELPVGARAGLDIFPAGVIVVPGEVLLACFLLDAFEDVALVLGFVGVDGLIVVGPQFDQRVLAVVFCAGGEAHVGQG